MHIQVWGVHFCVKLWEGRVYFLPGHTGRSGFWLSICCCRRSTCSWLWSIVSSLPRKGSVPSGQGVTSQLGCLKSPCTAFAPSVLRFPGKQNKAKHNKPEGRISELCFLANPSANHTHLKRPQLSWCYWQATRGRTSFLWGITQSPWVPLPLPGSLWLGCWGRCCIRAQYEEIKADTS